MNLKETFLLKFILLIIYLSLVIAEDQHHAEVSMASEGLGFRGTVKVNGEHFHLDLKASRDSVFSKNFKALVTADGPDGSIVHKDVSPSVKQIRDLEQNLYVDHESNAVFKINHHHGNVTLNGLLNNMHIGHNGERHIATIHRNNDPFKEQNLTQYLENVNKTHIRKRRQAGTTVVYPEVWFVLDNRHYNSFGRDTNKMIDYLQVFIRGINNRYATLSNPRIKFLIVGFTAMHERAHQTFMESNIMNDGSGYYEMGGVLRSFAKYMYTYRNDFNGHDVSPLLSGESFKYRSGSSVSEGVGGLSIVGGACTYVDRFQDSLKVSVNRDTGAFYGGILITAHELAHSLGSDHDGVSTSANCAKDSGNIMSVPGWGSQQKFYFSPCSANAMLNFINSEAGACVRSYQTPMSFGEALTNAGDRWNMDTMCSYFLRSDARADRTIPADQQCKILRCTYGGSTEELKILPFDNIPCGPPRYRCWNGRCIP